MKLIPLMVGAGDNLTHPADLATVLARHWPEVTPAPEEWERTFDPFLDPRIILCDLARIAQNRGSSRVSAGGPADGSAALTVGGDRGLCLVVKYLERPERGDFAPPQYSTDLIIQDDETAAALGSDLMHLAIQRTGLAGNVLRFRRPIRMLREQ